MYVSFNFTEMSSGIVFGILIGVIYFVKFKFQTLIQQKLLLRIFDTFYFDIFDEIFFSNCEKPCVQFSSFLIEKTIFLSKFIEKN